RAQVAESRRLLRRSLSGQVNRLTFIDDAKLNLSVRYARSIRLFTSWDLSKALALLKPLYGLLKGIPTDRPLRAAYWRKKMTIPDEMDPDRDGFEPMISLSLINGRAIAAVISICFDREVPGEDARALACYHRLLEAVNVL